MQLYNPTTGRYVSFTDLDGSIQHDNVKPYRSELPELIAGSADQYNELIVPAFAFDEYAQLFAENGWILVDF